MDDRSPIRNLAAPTPRVLLLTLAALVCASLSATVAAQASLPSGAFGDEYAAIGYTELPEDNAVSRLVERLEQSKERLPYDSKHLFLSSLLEALGIDAASQVLVYSKTSLQVDLISAATPRAIYFNDSTYVAWIPGSSVIEIVAMDPGLGPVFYILGATGDARPDFKRHTGTCLVCHDNFNGKGGGTPRLLVRSILTTVNGAPLEAMPIEVTDATPLEQRWGGWYVTGHDGRNIHRGNLQLRGTEDLDDLQKLHRGNLTTLENTGFFDTSLYLSRTSDVIALLVLEHQTSVQSQITFVRYKAPSVLRRMKIGDQASLQTWAELSPKAQAVLKPMMDLLVRRLTFTGAAPYADRISGTAGFEAGFQRGSPRDRAGRSLRDLDLQTRLMRYPLSYLIYSAEFDALPPFAKDYVYRSVSDALRGASEALYTNLSPEERRALREILLDTKPAFRGYL